MFDPKLARGGAQAVCTGVTAPTPAADPPK